MHLLHGVPASEKGIAFTSKYNSLLRYLYYIPGVNNAMANNLKENSLWKKELIKLTRCKFHSLLNKYIKIKTYYYYNY